MEVDDLQIALQGSANVAVAAVDSLIGALDKLQTALGGISSPVTKAVHSIDKLSESFERVGKSSGLSSAMDKAVQGTEKLSAAAKNASSTMQSEASAASTAVQRAADKAAEASNLTAYQAKLNARVAAQEQVAQAKAAAAEQIAQAKAAAQIEVAQEKQQLAEKTRSARTGVTLEEQLAAQQAIREDREKQIDAVVSKEIQHIQQLNSESQHTSTSEPERTYEPAQKSKMATSIFKDKERAATVQPSVNIQPTESTLQRLMSKAGQVKQSLISIFNPGFTQAQEAAKHELDTLVPKLDTINAKADLERSKLSQLYSKLESAGGLSGSGANSAKLQSQALTAESRLQSLSAQSDKAAARVRQLDSALNGSGISAQRAAMGLNEVSSAANRASSSSSWVDRVMQRMGRQLLSQMLIYSMIWPAIQKVGAYTGAALSTNDAFANSLNGLKVQLLTAFYPIYQAALPALTALINALAKAMEYIAAFVAGLFGTTYSAAQSGASSLNKGISAMEGQVAAAKNAASADKAAAGEQKKWQEYNDKLTKQQNEYATAVDKAQKKQEALNQAREDAKKSLLGIDELNVLENQNQTSSASSVTMPTEPTPPETPAAATPSTTAASIPSNLQGALNTDFGNVKPLIPQSAIDAAQAAGAKVRAIFNGLVTFFRQHKSTILSIFAGIVGGIVTFKIVSVIQKTINAFKGFSLISGLLKSPAATVIAVIAGVVIGLITLWNTNASFRDIVTKIWNTLSAFFTQHSATIAAAVNGIVTAFAAFKLLSLVVSGPIGIVIAIIAGAVIALVTLWNTNKTFRTNVINIWNAIKGFFITCWNGITGAFTGAKDNVTKAWQNVGKWFGDRWKDIQTAFKDTKDWFTQKFTDAKNGVQTTWNDVGSWFGKRKDDIQNAFANINGWFKDKFGNSYDLATRAFEGAGSFFGGVWGNIQGAFGDVGGWFHDRFWDAYNAVTGAWNGIGDFFSGLWNGIVQGVKGFVNDVIRPLNQMIDGIDKVQFNVPGWVPVLRGDHFGIDVPQIPYLANGGITGIDNPFMAVVGDNKSDREVISPLGDLYAMMKKAMKSIIGEMVAPPSLSAQYPEYSGSVGISNGNTQEEFLEGLKKILSPGSNGGDTNLDVTVKIGEDTIVDKVIKGINRKSKANGKPAIIV